MESISKFNALGVTVKKSVVLLSGKLHSGKNTFASSLITQAQEAGLTVETGLFAKPLKDGCREDFKSLAVFMEQQYNTLIVKGIPAKEISWMLLKDENFYEDKTELSRILLQLYGTEIFRNRVDPEYWLHKYVPVIAASRANLFIVTDFRFPNEIHRLLDLSERLGINVYSVRVVRPELAREGVTASHYSETALDTYSSWDFLCVNSGSLEQLSMQSKWFLDNKLIQ
jgi:hypothetical protein